MHRMYTVSKAPMKFVTKSRRGLNNIDRLDTMHDNKMKMELNNNEQVLDLPKPVFTSMSRKHHTHSSSNHLKKWQQDLTISPEHEELIRFISESWSSVFKEPDSSSVMSSSSDDSVSVDSNASTTRIVYYEDETSSSPLDEDFVPFDLEAWWGRRLFNNITKNIP